MCVCVLILVLNGEMWLKILAALLEDLNFAPVPRLGSSHLPVTPIPEDLMSSPDLLGHLYTGARVHTHKTLLRITLRQVPWLTCT